MANFIISYDLNKQGKNYDDLIKAIQQFPGWAKIQKSVWYVKANLTVQQVFNILREHMDDNDSLFVVDSTNNVAAWYGLSIKASDYIQHNWYR